MLNQKPNLGAIGESRVQRVLPEAPAAEGGATSDAQLYTIVEAQMRERAFASEAKDDLSGCVRMRMAKASKEDMDTVYRLMRLVDAIGDGVHPSTEDDAPDYFDEDDRDHLQVLYRLINEIGENSGGIHRVVGAADIFLNPKNNLIDPEDDCIELSPELKAAQKAAEMWEYFQGFIRAHSAVSITDLVMQRDKLEAENERLRELVAQKLVDSSMLTGIETKNGTVEIGIEGGAAGLLANAFIEQFRGSGAINSLEVGFSNKELGEIIVTIQRVEGLTPSQQRSKAVSERDALLAVLEKIVTETMDYPLVKPTSADSWIPRDLVAEAQGAITAVRGFPVPTCKESAP